MTRDMYGHSHMHTHHLGVRPALGPGFAGALLGRSLNT